MMFVSVEGIEGSGKSSLLALLAQRLRARGVDVVLTREPGGTPVGDAIRRIFLKEPDLPVSPLTEAFLVNASRASHVEEVVRPALAAGKLVLCDRYADSTLAYQGYGRGLGVDLTRSLCDAATGGLWPDVVLLLDLPVAAAYERVRDRKGGFDRLDGESADFHERVRAGFLELATSNPHWHVLDATLPTTELADLAMALL
ncbi:MAG TPA: dTMP kinase [Candidatus Baltobacteraceae bacterium]